jgi:hypothetical protein
MKLSFALNMHMRKEAVSQQPTHKKKDKEKHDEKHIIIQGIQFVVSHKKVAVGLSSKQRTGTTCRI